MIEDSIDHKGFCPRCGAKVMGIHYACPRCAKVLWKRKPDEKEADEESAVEVCKCGHRRSEHILEDRFESSPCIKLGCLCTAFTPKLTTSTE